MPDHPMFKSDRPDDDEQKRLSEMISELLDAEDGLTDWETSFLDSVNQQRGHLSARQGETIEKIWNRVLG